MHSVFGVVHLSYNRSKCLCQFLFASRHFEISIFEYYMFKIWVYVKDRAALATMLSLSLSNNIEPELNSFKIVLITTTSEAATAQAQTQISPLSISRQDRTGLNKH